MLSKYIQTEILLLQRSISHSSNKGHDVCCPVCGVVHIKDPLLLIEIVAYVVAADFLSRYLNGALPMSDAI